MPETSAWLTDDAAAYDAMRDAVIDRAATALLAGDIPGAAETIRSGRVVNETTRNEVDTFLREDDDSVETAS